MIARGRASLRAHPLLPGRSGQLAATLWLRPSHRPALRPQLLHVLAALARAAGALWLRREASPHAPAALARWLAFPAAFGSRGWAGPRGRRLPFPSPADAGGATALPETVPGLSGVRLQRARLSSSGRGRAQARVVWPPGRGRFRRREGRACGPT